MALVRSLYRSSSSFRSSLYSTFLGNRILNDSVSNHQYSRSFFNLSSSSSSSPLNRIFSDKRSPFGMVIGSTRTFSQDVAPLPDIKDSEIKAVFKDFIAADWGELPDSLARNALQVLSKDSDDNFGKEALKNVFRAAEAAEEFIGILDTFKMSIDDLVGLSGENVKPLPEHYSQALQTAYNRYRKYLDSFGPDETYLKKKVTVLGTSGISGSYVEQRGP
ncbi:Succinate dehydrogenase subunit 5 mitochondrial [Bienertia sinuspersici]